jgi:hypothetical protein
MLVSHWILMKVGNILDEVDRENQNTILCTITFFFFRKSCRLWDSVEKCGTAREATDKNMARAG